MTQTQNATAAHQPREGESPKRHWVELTEGEKAEAMSRGFPRGGDIRYFVRNGYRDGEWMLTRWTRLASPGNPRTDADSAAEALPAEVSVTVEGRPYCVKRMDDGTHKVFAVITRDPVNGRGFYQCETIYRTIKHDSRNYRAAMKAAGLR